MLFDLKGKRRRPVQITYAGLAVLIGLVLAGRLAPPRRRGPGGRDRGQLQGRRPGLPAAHRLRGAGGTDTQGGARRPDGDRPRLEGPEVPGEAGREGGQVALDRRAVLRRAVAIARG